jgi:hypothetical protein
MSRSSIDREHWRDDRSSSFLSSTPFDQPVPSERVLSGERLATLVATEGLDCEVNPLVPFEIVIPVEALDAFVTLEWPVDDRQSGSEIIRYALSHRHTVRAQRLCRVVPSE